MVVRRRGSSLTSGSKGNNVSSFFPSCMKPEEPKLPAESDYRSILTSWGFGPDEIGEALARIEASDGPRSTVVDFGTTALDVKRKGLFEHHPYMGGLALIGQDNRNLATGEPFVEPEASFAEQGHAGGIGNAANAVGSLLENDRRVAERVGETVGLRTEMTRRKVWWTLMARLGDDEAGRIFKGKIHGLIDTELMQSVSGTFSGLADIRIQREDRGDVKKGDRAIYFRAGASGTTAPTRQDLLEIAVRRPTNVNVSYPGLFPDGMDRDRGATLALFIGELQKVCPMVSFDVHGFTELKHIEPALSRADLWNMNLAEAAKIFLGESIGNPDELAYGEKIALLLRIEQHVLSKYVRDTTKRPRMFTISDRKGCYVIFQSIDGNVLSTYCRSPCAEIGAVDKTGAGDVRFGLQRFFLAREKAQEWKDGSIRFGDIMKAVQIGQIASTLQVQGKESRPFDGVTLASLERVAGSGAGFETLEDLHEALRTG